MQQVLDDYTSAPIPETLRTTLGVLRKMTLDHQNLGPEDVRVALNAGVSKAALREAMEVAYLFNVYDRLADALGWDVPAVSGGAYKSSAKTLLSRGYRL